MKIYVTYHPSSVIEGGFHLERYIRDDFERLKRKQLKSPRKALPRSGAKVVGFDTEYTPTGALLTAGVADSQCADAIETTDKRWIQRITPIIKRATTLVGHSVGGDLDYLVKNKLAKEAWLRGEDILDSLLLARMVDENRGKGGYALEPLLLSHFNFAQWKLATAKLLKETGDASSWTVEQRVQRCRIDAWATRILGEKLLLLARTELKDVRKLRLT
jgi:hypothetical protein